MDTRPTEEDTELLSDFCTGSLGKNGRMIERSESALLDTRLYTAKHGVLWWGDLEYQDLHKVETIAKQAQCPVHVRRENADDIVVAP